MITQFKKGALELCVLSLLNKKDCYGYEIVETISSAIEVSEGTIYPLLRRLTNDDYCNTYLKESNEGPPRKYYKISDIGNKHFIELKSEWNDFSDKVSHILNIDFRKEETND